MADLYDEVQNHGGHPVSLGEQAEGHLGADVGLVTLTIGGNDEGFPRCEVLCLEVELRG